MKTLNLPNPKPAQKVLLVFLVIFSISCSDIGQDEMIPANNTVQGVSQDWIETLNQLDLASTIIVQNESSIQEAINVAQPGDIIYIEPGNYNEEIILNKSDISLVGLSDGSGESVMLKHKINGETSQVYNLYGDGFEIKTSAVADLSAARKGRKKCLLNLNRSDLGAGIAHYQLELRMGDGPYDVVKLHRVVKEHHPYRPLRTKGDIFMVHGGIQDFDDIFLTAGAEVINEKTSAPFYLASQGIDVWGIDLGWTRVPVEMEDFSFMEGWGVEKDVTHTLKAMSIARIIRGLSGQSFCRLNLLGFSYGLTTAYGAANRETQFHHILRNVKGIIPVDSKLTTDDINIQEKKCTEAQYWMDSIELGYYNRPWGVDFIIWGSLAIEKPDSYDIHPELTNSQFLEFVGTQGFFGGSNGKMLYTDPSRFFKLSENLSPHMPLLMFYDMPAAGCPTLDVSYVDHLSEIRVPILYIGAGGSAGEGGYYTVTQTASMDTEKIIVSVTEDPVTDYGHADLWMGYDADELLWVKLKDWLFAHKK